MLLSAHLGRAAARARDDSPVVVNAVGQDPPSRHPEAWAAPARKGSSGTGRSRIGHE